MKTDEYRYWAFVSYSHQDKKWGEWLLKTIETFSVPDDLVGRDGDFGEVPANLFPLFRDRDELPVAADLGEKIEEALTHSRFLIVVCSPASAKSQWVNREISTFKALGRSRRVLSVIVDGEPGISDDSERADQECFPPALRYVVDSNGELTDEPAEPLAADARGGRSANRDASLKIIAGMLGVSFDALKRRDDARKIRRQRVAIASLLALTTVVSGLAYYANDRRVVANDQTVIAQSRQLASKAQFLVGTDPAALMAGVLLAIQSIRRHRTFEADALLREGVRLLPTPVQHFEHAGIVSPLAVSVAQNYVAAALLDGTSRVWDVRDFREIAVFEMSSRLTRIAVSKDGQHLVTGDREGIVQVWDTSTQSEVYSTECDGEVTSLVFNSGSNLLAIACENAPVFVVGADDWSVHAEMADPGRRGEPIGLAFGFDRLAAVTSNGSLQVWDLTSGEELKHIPGDFPGAMCCNAVIAFSGRYLAGKLIPTGNLLQVWDTQTWELETTIRHDADIQAISFSMFNDYFATGDTDGKIHVWDPYRWQLVSSMEHGAEIIHLEFDRQREQLVSASSDKTARVWDVQTGEELVRVIHRGPVAYAGFVQASRRLASFADDGRLSIWETPGTDFDWRTQGGQALDICVHASGQEITVAFPGYAYRLALVDKSYTDRILSYLQANDATVSRDCRFAAYVDRNRRGQEILRVYDLEEREEAWTLEPQSIESLAFSPDSRYLAVAYWNHREEVFDVASGAAVKSWSTDRFDNARVEFARSGDLLASIYDSSITFRAAEKFDIVHEIDLSTRIFDFAAEPAGGLVAAGTLNGVILIDTGTFEQTTLSIRDPDHQSRSDLVKVIAFSTDNGLLAAAGRSLRVWNTRSKRLELTIEGITNIEFLAFNARGDKLIAVERSRPAPGIEMYVTHVWEIESGEELVRINSDRTLGAAALSLDDNILINGAVHPFSVETLVNEACARIAWDFDAEEWAGLALGMEQTPSCPRAGSPPTENPR